LLDVCNVMAIAPKMAPWLLLYGKWCEWLVNISAREMMVSKFTTMWLYYVTWFWSVLLSYFTKLTMWNTSIQQMGTSKSRNESEGTHWAQTIWRKTSLRNYQALYLKTSIHLMALFCSSWFHWECI